MSIIKLSRISFTNGKNQRKQEPNPIAFKIPKRRATHAHEPCFIYFCFNLINFDLTLVAIVMPLCLSLILASFRLTELTTCTGKGQRERCDRSNSMVMMKYALRNNLYILRNPNVCVSRAVLFAPKEHDYSRTATAFCTLREQSTGTSAQKVFICKYNYCA